MKIDVASDCATGGPAMRLSRIVFVFCIGVTAQVAICADRPETAVLPPEAYRMPMDQVIVTGQAPYWRGDEAPRWDKPKVDVQTQSAPSRLQWAPHYSRDERDDYNGVRDQLNPQARGKLFELKF